MFHRFLNRLKTSTRSQDTFHLELSLFLHINRINLTYESTTFKSRLTTSNESRICHFTLFSFHWTSILIIRFSWSWIYKPFKSRVDIAFFTLSYKPSLVIPTSVNCQTIPLIITHTWCPNGLVGTSFWRLNLTFPVFYPTLLLFDNLKNLRHTILISL